MLTTETIKATTAHEWLMARAEGYAEFYERRDRDLRNPPQQEPTAETRYYTLGKVRAARDGAMGVPSAASVAKLADGRYVTDPTSEEKRHAVAIYLGGRKNPVDEAEAKALRAQGFHVGEERVPV